jgi:hypothetical protein
LIGACSWCSADGVDVHQHHPTGRHDGVPYHASFVRALCLGCHLKMHGTWRRGGLDALSAGPVLLIRRIAFDLGQRPHGLAPGEAALVALALDDIACRLGGEAL